MSAKPIPREPAERIDTHLHLLYPDRFDYSWTTDFPELSGAFEIEDYQAAAASCEIAGSLFMEVDVDTGQGADEARYFCEMARAANSPLLGVVASARPEDDGFEKYLDLIAHPALKGIRRVLHTKPDDLSTSSTFRSNVALLASSRLTFDLCVQQRQLPIAVELVDACPDTSFILDHCGSPDIAGNGLQTWAESLRTLALRPNVACKISGLPSYCTPGLVTKGVLQPYIETVIDAFGWDRVTWGGDWPVCRLNSTLRDWCTVLDEILSGETTDNLEKLYSRNARRLYRLTSLSGRASPFVMEHDSLTALPSHTAFQVHLSEKVKEAVRDGSSVGLAVMDLDHFSALNHAEGHSKGDELLIWLARVLANLIEEGEFAARIGGDEFALVLNSEGTSAMIARMERLRLQVEGHCQPVTLSVGIATYPRDARDAEELLKCVDDALYVAKRGGRNLVCASKSLEERFCKPIVDEDDSGPGSLVTRPDPPSGLSGGGAVRLP